MKGISKGNGHALKTVFIAPLKWWGTLKHNLQNRHNRLYKIITYFKTGQIELPRFFYIDRKNENLGWMNSICTADWFSITQNVNQDCTINHCLFNLFHASINRNTTNSYETIARLHLQASWKLFHPVCSTYQIPQWIGIEEMRWLSRKLSFKSYKNSEELIGDELGSQKSTI